MSKKNKHHESEPKQVLESEQPVGPLLIEQDHDMFPREVPYRDVGLFTDKVRIYANEVGAGGASTDYEIHLITGTKEFVDLKDLRIKFQEGNPLEEVNGFTNEALLSIVYDRYKGFHEGPFDHPTTIKILAHLNSIFELIEERTLERRERQVEGLLEK